VHLAFQLAEDAFSLFADTTLIYYLLVPFLSNAAGWWSPDELVGRVHKILVGVLALLTLANPAARIYQLWTGVMLTKEDKAVVDATLSSRAGVLVAYRGITIASAVLYLVGAISLAVCVWHMLRRSRQLNGAHFRFMTRCLCIAMPALLIVRAVERLIFTAAFIVPGKAPGPGAQLADVVVYAVLSLSIYWSVLGLHFSKDMGFRHKAAAKDGKD
jgi:hypothetical protein